MKNKLQLYFFALLILLTISNAQSQEVSFDVKHTFSLDDPNIYVDKILYADNDAIILDNTYRSYKAQNLNINLKQAVRLDNQFKQTNTIDFEEKFKDWNLGNDIFENFQNFATLQGNVKSAKVKDGFLVFLFNEKDKKENKYAVAKVDSKLNTSEAKTFLTISKEDLAKYNMLRAFVSPDLTKVAVISERNYAGKKQELFYPGTEVVNQLKKIYITVLDNNGNTIWNNSFNFDIVDENNIRFNDIAVANNGSVMLYGKIYQNFINTKRVVNKTPENTNGLLYVIDQEGKNIKQVAVPQVNVDLPKDKAERTDGTSIGIKYSNLIALNNPNQFAYVTSVNNNDFPESISTFIINGNGEIVNTITQAIPAEYKAALANAKATTLSSFASFINVSKIFNDKDDHLSIVLEGINILQLKYKYIGASAAGNYIDYYKSSVFYSYLKKDNKPVLTFSPISKQEVTEPVYEKNTNLFEQPYYHFYNDKIYIFKKRGVIEDKSKYTKPTVVKNTVKFPDIDYEALFLDVLDLNGQHTHSKLTDFKNEETRIDVYSGYMTKFADNKIIYFETDGKGRKGSRLFAYNKTLGIITIK